MSFEKLEAAVIAEAEAEASNITAAAKAEADAYLERVRAENDRVFDEACRQAQAAEGRETSREVGLARHEGRLGVLEAKNRVIDGVFKTAEERLAALPDEEYLALMAAWLKALPAEVGGTLRVSPRDERRFTKAFLDAVNVGRPAGGRFDGVAADVRIGGGFVVAGETYSVDVTIDTKIHALRESLAGDIAGELFGS